jgi:cobalt/nickel transport system permease protein
LEYVAEQGNFLSRALDPSFAILPDYTLPFITHPAATTIFAVMLGTLLVFALALIIGRRAAHEEG